MSTVTSFSKPGAAQRSPHRNRLLALVEEIAEGLRAGADASEDARLLVPGSLHLLRDSGLLRALAPTEVGGWQVDPVTELELIEAVSAIDGSTGWMFWALAGSTARAASMMPDPAAREVFGGNRFGLIAFDERPYDNVLVVEGATVRVRGMWRFGTGASCADWVVAIGHREPSDGTGASLLAAIVPTSDVEIVDEWDPSGLSGTGTVGYRIADLLVPPAHSWAYPPAGPPVRGGVHFCGRRAAVKHLGFALGVARSSIAAFTPHIAGRRAGSGGVSAAVTADLARAQLQVDAARELGFAAVTAMWEEAWSTGAVSARTYRRVRATARYATEVAVDVCGLVARHGDVSLLGRQNPLQRNLRDITAAAAHAEIGPVVLDEFGGDLLARDEG